LLVGYLPYGQTVNDGLGCGLGRRGPLVKGLHLWATHVIEVVLHLHIGQHVKDVHVALVGVVAGSEVVLVVAVVLVLTLVGGGCRL
jgi:hypothetical protein